MNALDSDPLIQDIRCKLREEITAITEQMQRGKCTSFDQYQRLVGRVDGIERALERIAEAIANYTQDEDE